MNCVHFIRPYQISPIYAKIFCPCTQSLYLKLSWLALKLVLMVYGLSFNGCSQKRPANPGKKIRYNSVVFDATRWAFSEFYLGSVLL